MRIPGKDAFRSALRSYRRHALAHRLQQCLQDLADREDGTTVRDAYTDEFPRVRFSGQGWVSWMSLTLDGPRRVRVTTVCRSRLADDAQMEFPGLELQPVWQRREFPVPWMRVVQAGDAALDARFGIYSQDGRSVAHVFTPEVKRGILAFHHGFGQAGLAMTLGGRTLTLRKVLPAETIGLETLREMAGKAHGIFLAVREVFEVAPEHLVRVVACEVGTAESRCRVCGEPLDASPVYCAACETPHHVDCWHYLGRCSTFACGARAYLRRPSPAGPDEMRLV